MTLRIAATVFIGAATVLGSQAAHARENYPDTARTANFLVDAPSTSVAKLVAQRAEELRRKIAVTWFGSELPKSEHVNLVYVEVDEGRSVGRTFVSPVNDGHFVSLVGPIEEVSEHMLAHEVTHTVIAARYGLDFPAWANEGIASIYDDRECYLIREGIERDFVLERIWPNLAEVLARPIRSQTEYTVAASLTQFFLARGSRSQFMQFSELGLSRGWDVALHQCYAIRDVAQLQDAWQAWITDVVIDRRHQRNGPPVARLAHRSIR